MRNLLITLMLINIICCTSKSEEKTSFNSISEGNWRAVLTTQGGDLPFNFSFFIKDSLQCIQIENAEERLLIEDIEFKNDSIIIPGYIFESEIRAKIIDSTHLIGEFIKLDTKEPYRIPFEAWADKNYRFILNPEPPKIDVSGNWEVTFDHDGDITKAVGKFKQQGNKLEGTFLTSTGDYRYLEGQVENNQIHLSCFDGAHAFLFNAKLENDTLIGDFYSGLTWHETWTAVRNDTIELPNPDSLTYLVDGYDKFEFSFPNVETGENISSSDERFQNKVTIVQIMGSWCPNCMDETRFLIDLKNKFPELEIVALAFEKHEDFEKAAKRVRTLKEKLNVNYDFVIAGTHAKESASKSLPMLNEIISYPTTILVDKQGEVRNIHTGFSGLGTGEKYHNFATNYTLKVKNLLYE